MELLYVPPDNESTKQKRGKGYFGVCGPSTIAVLTNKTVKEIISIWEGGFKGYAPIKELQATLEKLGYFVNRQKGHKSRTFPTPTTNVAILRIQWLKEDGTEFYWAAQTPNTHYVIMQKLNSDKSTDTYGEISDDGEWWIFCNGQLWFKKDSKQAKDYLKLGYVSSYLEISLNQRGNVN